MEVSAKSCGLPAKIRVSWANEAKVTANVIGRCASRNNRANRCARSYVLPACTKANSENEARVIVRGIAKPVAARETPNNGGIGVGLAAEA